MDRGNSRSVSRKPAARSSDAAPRYIRRKASCAPQDRSSVVQLGPAEPASARVVSSRAVMSARSIDRPSTMKFQVSSRDVAESMIPATMAARSRTQVK